MNKEFVPYDIALAMKELGFDEECLGVYYPDLADNVEWIPSNMFNRETFIEKGFMKAPLYQQAFRWFRDKYGLIKQDYMFTSGVHNHAFIVYDKIKDRNLHDCCYNENDEEIGVGFVEYEEAELDCLRKLIKIVKDENKER